MNAPPVYHAGPSSGGDGNGYASHDEKHRPYGADAPVDRPYGYAPQNAPQKPLYYQPQQQQQQQQYGMPMHANNDDGPYPPAPAPQYTEKFQPVQGFPDVWATILFLANLVGFCAYAGLSAIPQFALVMRQDQRADMSLQQMQNWHAVGYSIALAVGIASIFAFLMSLFMRKFTKQFISFALYSTIALNFAVAVLFFAYGSIVAGVIALVSALFYTWVAMSWRARIPFATIMMQTVIDISRRFNGTIITSVLALLTQALWTILWTATLVGTVQLYNNENQRGSLGGIIFWSLFTFYWTTQVIKNVQHVTLAGVYATFYFLFNTQQMPSNPTAASANRALGKSFGPICFGSLLVAVIQLLRQLAQNARNDRDNNAFVQILACLAACILSMIEDLLEYFNRYAFTQVAIYGKSFIQAAKDTWRLVKSHGIDAIINDNLIGNVLGISSLLIGVATGAISFGFVYTQTSGSLLHAWTAAAAGLFIGGTFQMVLGEVITSGVATTFVCLAEDPQALLRTKPALYQAIAETYQGVLHNRV